MERVRRLASGGLRRGPRLRLLGDQAEELLDRAVDGLGEVDVPPGLTRIDLGDLGERADFARLVLGCIEANFCK